MYVRSLDVIKRITKITEYECTIRNENKKSHHKFLKLTVIVQLVKVYSFYFASFRMPFGYFVSKRKKNKLKELTRKSV